MDEKDGGRRRGAEAEDIAELWLRWRGWTVLDRNRRGGGGEIDIIARDGRCLVFVEVRCRRRGSWVSAAATIGPEKRRRLRACARSLLSETRFRWSDRRIRFDVITIESGPDGFGLRHLRNVRLGPA